MSERNTPLTADRLRALLDYDPETGVFRWRVQRQKHKAGAVAGVVNRAGYRRIKTGGVNYSAHRLAFLWVTGAWPTDEVDHVNGTKDDNRWANLRAATHSQNQWNRTAYRNNTSGHKGVFRRERRGRVFYSVRIRAHGAAKHLGDFADIESAQQAYAAEAARLHGVFATC